MPSICTARRTVLVTSLALVLISLSGCLQDLDGDGYATPDDCNDFDPSVHPGAPEVCDAVDDDCDGEIDEDGSVGALLRYPDSDLDGWGAPTPVVLACILPVGHVDLAGDCDDGDAAVHPGALEVCDGLDNDCDGTVDGLGALDAVTWYPDEDGDGVGGPGATVLACDAPAGYADQDGDCDDDDPSVFPGASESCDGIDNDCDGVTDPPGAVGASPWYDDLDGDGYGDPLSMVLTCAGTPGQVVDGSDCDDADGQVHPGAAELCNDVDDDCDDEADEGSAYELYPDADGDGHGAGASWWGVCSGVAGYSPFDDDCDDGDPAVYPGAPELCDTFDNDCDGLADEGLPVAWYADADGDGWGEDGLPVSFDCAPVVGAVSEPGDCDDADPAVHPGAAEVCDGDDTDCDGLVSADEQDIDGDTFPPCAGDCDELDASVYPGAVEVCDGLDGDCDGLVPVDELDADGDGLAGCDGDCDDLDPAVHPAAEEVCNGLDDDCDGTVDLDATDPATWFADADGDGFGDAATALQACDQPAGHAAAAGDCDDADASVYPGAAETCDGQDEDCDGLIDEVDVDGDGSVDAGCGGDDCDDAEAMINPGAAELCGNGLDDDCDGLIDGADSCWDCDLWVPGDAATVQAGIDDASDGEVVCLEPGTWVETVDFGGREVGLLGVGGTACTILDGGGAGPVVTLAAGEEGPDAFLARLTVTGGVAVDGGGLRIIDSSPDLANLVVTGNESTGNGGGIYIHSGDPVITDLVLDGNLAGGRGGGLWVGEHASPEISRARVTDSEAGTGGGLYATGVATPQFDSVTLAGNVAANGGGLAAFYGSSPSFYGAVFYDNHANAGGAVHENNSHGVFQNVTVHANQAVSGAGFYLYHSGPELRNVALHGNDASQIAGAVYLTWSSPELRNVDISVNEAFDCAGIYAEGAGTNPTVTYTNLWGNVALSGNAHDFCSSAGNFLDSPVGDDGNIAVDPGYLDTTPADPADWDLHLDPSLPSGLIDAGDPTLFDPAGDRSDIGTWGGAGAGDRDRDGDGYYEWWQPGPGPGADWDCDDDDPSVFPGSGC